MTTYLCDEKILVPFFTYLVNFYITLIYNIYTYFYLIDMYKFVPVITYKCKKRNK